MIVSPAGRTPGAPTGFPVSGTWVTDAPPPSDDMPRGAPGGPQLVVRTVAVDDLPDTPTALVDRLPDTNALAWVRHGDGLVGWGEALRFETFGPGRFADGRCSTARSCTMTWRCPGAGWSPSAASRSTMSRRATSPRIRPARAEC
jgi:hypothetical protein